MSKRFIDTGIFDDDWFMDLSKDAKLLWVYSITKCDHAGILKLNEKLCRVQTDIKDLNGVIIQLGNHLVTVSKHLYFIPKFIEFQYPGFPKSNVKQQESAMEILIKYGLFYEGKITVSKELMDSHVNDNGIINDIVNDNEKPKIDFEIFWNLYNKKLGSKDNCNKKWDKLSLEIQQKIINILPDYHKSITDKTYQPYPETWLNQKRWENEIIIPCNLLISGEDSVQRMTRELKEVREREKQNGNK